MFKKSRWKIVLSILLILILLLVGTFLVIYLASYAELTSKNQRLLEQYVQEYSLMDKGTSREPMDGSPYHPPRLELSTFYSVAVSKSGQVMKVDTADMSVLDDDALIEIATEIIDSGKSSGVTRNLIYLVEDKGVYNLVAFLDNTVMLENAGTLLNYTLIFGGVALVALFLLAMFLANWIVTPLEESYKRQKQFVADAGHELKTPVAVINANLELLAGETGENQWLSNIRYENERMSALISQLLDLARAENAKPPMGVVDFSRLVYGEALPFETYAYESGLKLEYDVSDDILVYGNSVQLRQLVCVLIDNAICHSSNGNEIFISLKKEKKHVRLCVVNSGEEIPAEQRKYLFERFYRLDAARPDDKNNYGLGLAIAKAIVTVHKGTIQLRCESGKVELIVKLPVAKQKHKN